MLRPVTSAVTKVSQNPAMKSIVRTTVDSTRHSIVTYPPKERVSFAEKVMHGVFMAVGILTPPYYIASHYKDYRGEDD